jgi:hypothetical protein
MGVIDSTNPSSQRVAPLEHVVHPEGHVAERNANQRVAPLEHVVHPEGHVAQQKQTRRVAPLEHVVRPEGHVAWMMMMRNLDDPKTLTPDKILKMTPLIKLSPCSNQNLN